MQASGVLSWGLRPPSGAHWTGQQGHCKYLKIQCAMANPQQCAAIWAAALFFIAGLIIQGSDPAQTAYLSTRPQGASHHAQHAGYTIGSEVVSGS